MVDTHMLLGVNEAIETMLSLKTNQIVVLVLCGKQQQCHLVGLIYSLASADKLSKQQPNKMTCPGCG
eukprot:scaffold4931_cov196-Alexandrium_tamarense.AAC.2